MRLLTKKQEREFEDQKLALEEKSSFIDSNIDSANKTLEESKDTQKGNLEIGKELYKLVAENKEKENILLAREHNIQSQEHDLEERKNKIRKEEVVIEARKAEVRKNESEVSKKETDVKEREAEAKKVKSESEQAKEKYQTLFDELKEQKENIKKLEDDAKRKSDLATKKEASADAIFEKAKTIDEEIKAKEAEFEARKEEIESSLNAKIEEYDRKLEDISNTQEFIDNIKFDDSEDGKAAKIVVKEAIRKAKESLKDIKTQFDELDEKYCSGTFKGFSIPIFEIDKFFEDLKCQYELIKGQIDECKEDLPNSIYKWVDIIEDYINNADKNIKLWEFSEAYRNIVFGLSACKHYVLLVDILNDKIRGGTDTEEENKKTPEEKFFDWYEILEINSDASYEDIKKKHRELSKKYHPDKNQTIGDEEKKEFEEKMHLINQAREILQDKEKRREFDEERKKHKK